MPTKPIATFLLLLITLPARATLLLHYSFDEAPPGSAAPAADTGANTPAPGTFQNGAIRVSTTPGNASPSALWLPNANSRLSTLLDVDKINALPTLTITMWINVQSFHPGYNVLMSDAPSSPIPAGQGGWVWRARGPGGALAPTSFEADFIPVYPDTGSSLFDTFISPIYNASNTWLFLAVTLDGSSVNYYAGNESSLPAPYSYHYIGWPALTNDTPFILGAAEGASDQSPDIFLDDIRIYDTPLDSAALNAIRLANLPDPATPLAFLISLPLFLLRPSPRSV
jgi:hypothetical protein